MCSIEKMHSLKGNRNDAHARIFGAEGQLGDPRFLLHLACLHARWASVRISRTASQQRAWWATSARSWGRTTWSAFTIRRRCALTTAEMLRAAPALACSPPPLASSTTSDHLHLFALQITRFNTIVRERQRKVDAGLPVPPTVAEQVKAGELTLPWTDVK